MVSEKKAVSILLNKYPKKKVTQIIDYDSKWFLLLAVENPNKVDFDSPYFAVNKQSGAIRSYSPIDDLDKFTEAIQNRVKDL